MTESLNYTDHLIAALRCLDDENLRSLATNIINRLPSNNCGDTAPEQWRSQCLVARIQRDETLKELRHLADLLDAHFERGGTVAGMGTTNNARRILSLHNA